MGVLDDAIREHLDLKLKRGADPGEVEKEASEALGPARREPASALPVEDAPEVEPGVAAEVGEETAAVTPLHPAEPEPDEVPAEEQIAGGESPLWFEQGARHDVDTDE